MDPQGRAGPIEDFYRPDAESRRMMGTDGMALDGRIPAALQKLYGIGR
jgi:hypothetical protein